MSSILLFKKHLLIAAFTVLNLTSLAQNWEEKFNGLVVLEDNTVIKGYLKLDAGDKERGLKIKLLKEPNEDPQIFYSYELKGYVYKKDTFKIFHQLKPFADADKVIANAEAKILQNGRLTLYEIREESDGYIPVTESQGHTSQMRVSSTGLIYMVRSAKNELVGIDRKNFKTDMHDLIPDATSILGLIDNKIYRFQHLRKIIKDYNQGIR